MTPTVTAYATSSKSKGAKTNPLATSTPMQQTMMALVYNSTNAACAEVKASLRVHATAKETDLKPVTIAMAYA